jgi:hypothetical protein
MDRGPKNIDAWLDVFRKQVDQLEKAGTRSLDRLAERGVAELKQWRDQVASNSPVSSARKAERASRGARARERSERKAAKAAKREHRAERMARRATRSAERARQRAEAMRGRGHNRRFSRWHQKDDRSPAEIEHDRLVTRARRRANQRIAFLTHFGSYLATLGILLVTTRSFRVVAVVGLSWGIGVFCHYLWALTAPALRDRWVEQEVGARSPRGDRATA